MNTFVAIPSDNPGGLNGTVAQHFGHCDLYTLISIENNKIGHKIQTLIEES
jgi:predicted Fe-Mo cluster-binding NifX family protein